MTMTSPKRNLCLTVFLSALLFANGLTVIFYLFTGRRFVLTYPHTPDWLFYPWAVGSALNVLFAIFLFRWRKWAFYAFCLVAAALSAIDASFGVPLRSAGDRLVGAAALYGVLQIGRKNKGWPQLK
jgi:hypothetical protein